jgi:ATP phosphoribosyltransferase regulatory subunit
MMAMKSLAAISSEYVLEISHMGVLADLLSNVEEGLQARLLALIGQKNAHDLRRICEEEHVPPELTEALATLVDTYGDYKKVLKKLSTLPMGERGREALQQLSDVVGLLASYRMASRVNLDFSIVNDLTYYSGILFKGYIAGIPQAVLSGGRYDKLMGYMGKKGGAIGFGVYLDELDLLDPGNRDYDVDVLFQYTLEDDLRVMYKVIRELIHGGQTVLAEKEIPEKLRYRKLIRLDGNEVITVEED